MPVLFLCFREFQAPHAGFFCATWCGPCFSLRQDHTSRCAVAGALQVQRLRKWSSNATRGNLGPPRKIQNNHGNRSRHFWGAVFLPGSIRLFWRQIACPRGARNSLTSHSVCCTILSLRFYTTSVTAAVIGIPKVCVFVGHASRLNTSLALGLVRDFRSGRYKIFGPDVGSILFSRFFPFDNFSSFFFFFVVRRHFNYSS